MELLFSMANVLYLMDDEECEDFFRMNVDKHWSWFQKKKHSSMTEDNFIEIQIYYISCKLSLCIDLVTVFSHSGMAFDMLRMVVKELQLPMLLILTVIQREIWKHVIGVFPRVKKDETFLIVDGTYSKCATIPFT